MSERRGVVRGRGVAGAPVNSGGAEDGGTGPANGTPASRRAFIAGITGLGLAGGLGLGLSLGLDSCGGGSHSPYSGGRRAVALAAALENQLVNSYKTIDAALSAGKLGPEVPALSAFVKTALAHHAEHAATWNAILRAEGKPAVTGTPLSGDGQVTSLVKSAKTADAAVAALRHLENQAAQTYTASVASLTSLPKAVTATATIAPVEAMHAAALGYLFGGRSAVSEFIGTSGAVSLKELTL